MNVQAERLLREALQLPPEARAALAESLFESLEPDAEPAPDVEDAWRAEVERRAEEIDSGVVQTIPWSEARRRILMGVDA